MALKESQIFGSLTVSLMDSYMAGTLPDAMRKWLDERLAADPALRRDMEAHRLTVAALRDAAQRHNDALTQALRNTTPDDMETLLTSLRRLVERDVEGGEDPGVRAAATAYAGTTLGTTVIGDSADARAALPSGRTARVPAASRSKREPEKKSRGWLWNTLAAAAIAAGVWVGARSVYVSQGAQHSADTYIATQTAATTPRGEARGSDEPLAPGIKDLSTDTVCLAEVTPQYESAEVIMQQATFMLRNGSYAEAIALLEPLYADSGVREVGLLLASAYVKAHEDSKARDLLAGLNERYPTDPEVQALLESFGA